MQAPMWQAPGTQAPGITPPTWQAPPWGPPTAYHPASGAAGPKRSRAAVLVTVVAAVVALACLGFGTATFFVVRHLDDTQAVGAPGDPTDLPTDDPAPEPTGQPQPDSGPAHGGNLEKYVIDRPATAHAWPRVKADQALDLTGAAANFADPAEGKLILQRYDFKDGYARRWIDEEGNYVVVRLLRFRTRGDADNFASFYINANQRDWGEPRDVPGLPTAAGFVKPKPEKNGLQRSLAVGLSGDIVAIVLADQLPPADADVPDNELVQEFKFL